MGTRCSHDHRECHVMDKKCNDRAGAPNELFFENTVKEHSRNNVQNISSTCPYKYEGVAPSSDTI